MVKNSLPPTHPLRLGTELNLSVFYYEILQEPGKAIMIANQALEEAFANIDKINEGTFKVNKI
jgi:14-3-3 protein epsilon